jgi:hypothetical protein
VITTTLTAELVVGQVPVLGLEQAQPSPLLSPVGPLTLSPTAGSGTARLLLGTNRSSQAATERSPLARAVTTWQASRRRYRVAWIGAVSPSLLPFTDAGAAGPPIARRKTRGPRPRRSRPT